MRVLQLIDSLQIGGAERVAVNYANALSTEIDMSFLCATRTEGELIKEVSDDVEYLFLSKTKVVDFKAIKLLSKFIRKNRIDVIHAHSSSFFFATLIKIFNNNLKIVWHDHLGDRPASNNLKNIVILRLCSVFFNYVLVVNHELKTWIKSKLHFRLVEVINNYSVLTCVENNKTLLEGLEGKRIVCLANLRNPKNHILLLKSFLIVLKEEPNCTLHLVGKDYDDSYSKSIKVFIKDNNLEKSIFIHNQKKDIANILSQSDIGVLASTSEGLPISLLEYGLLKLAVVVSNVGDCNKVIINSSHGRLVKTNNEEEFSKAILELVKDTPLCKRLGEQLNLHVNEKFSKNQAIKKLKEVYKSILNA